jgi:hypothetical protein
MYIEMKVFISVQKMFNPTHLKEMFNVLNSESKSGCAVRAFFTKNAQVHDTTSKWWSAKTT